MAFALACLTAGMACARRPRVLRTGAGTIHIQLHWPPHDSTELTLRGSVHPCRGVPAIALTGVDGGNGVLILVRTGKGPAVGDYSIVVRGDSTSSRGAMMSTRFMLGEIARGFGLDSGKITVTVAGSRVSATARGSGLDYSAGQRVNLAASATALPMSNDTASCRVQL